VRAIDKEKQGMRIASSVPRRSARPLHVEELAEILFFANFQPQEGLHRHSIRMGTREAEEAGLSACSTLVAIVNVRAKKLWSFQFSVKGILDSDRIASSQNLFPTFTSPKDRAYFSRREC